MDLATLENSPKRPKGRPRKDDYKREAAKTERRANNRRINRALEERAKRIITPSRSCECPMTHTVWRTSQCLPALGIKDRVALISEQPLTIKSKGALR